MSPGMLEGLRTCQTKRLRLRLDPFLELHSVASSWLNRQTSVEPSPVSQRIQYEH